MALKLKPGLLWVRSKVNEAINAARDSKINTPSAVNTRLPNVARCTVFLRLQRGVTEIGKKKSDAAVNGALNFRDKIRIALEEAFGVVGAH